MPELPEVESARQIIERSGLGRTITGVDDSDTYECRPHAPGELRDALLGRELTRVHRRGKLMWCETSDDGPLLAIHLGMSGRIVVGEVGAGEVGGGDVGAGERDASGPRAAKDEWYRFTLIFADGSSLRLFDKRRLGRVRLDPDLDALGPDAGEIDRDTFRERVGRGTAPLKARLLDQGVIAGIGNLLADEVLWQSSLSPRRPAGALSESELDELRRQLRRSIKHAIAHGGVHTGEIIAHRARGGHCPRCGQR